MKKWFSLLFVAALMLFVNVGWTSAAEKQSMPALKLFLDGKVLAANVPPALVNSSVLVPIRTVAENLGYIVDYDGKKKQVSVKEGATTILMTMNNPIATVNGKSVTMTEPPMLQSDRALIPLRFVGETLGLQILWDNSTKSVFLYSSAPGNDDTDTGSPGTGTDTDTDDGTDTGGTPDDGGPIGVEDGHDEPTDDSSGTPPPEAIPTHLHQIRYEPDAVIVTYDGLAVPATNLLTDPDRIVIDLPNADYAEDFSAGFSPGIIPDYTAVLTGIPALGQITELSIDGHDWLSKIRYSQYQDSPKIARIVLDLNRSTTFEIVNDPQIGELRILLKEQPVKSGYTVVLDAGHGGSDPGARSITGKWEKDFNLSVVKKVYEILLNEPKINLVLTRQDDAYPTLDDRVNLANSLQSDLFLSVHANSFNPSTNGTETYYTRANSLDFAKLLHKNVVTAAGLKDNGVRTANFKVIKATTMPAALLEVGYLTHANDEKMLFSNEFQNRVAAAIAESIKQYFKLV